MARRRFFVDTVSDGSAELRDEDAHHLARVLRAETGQQYELSDGTAAYLAQVREVGKNAVRFTILERWDEPAPPAPLILFMALIKFDRFEWVVEKATELGVTRIVPVECARSESGLLAASDKRAERWRKIARESGQQCRRLAAPAIDPAQKVAELLPEGTACRLEEAPGATPLLSCLRNTVSSHSISLLVGPEGGWTESERAAMDAGSWLPASLGPLILRAETAAVAALAIAAGTRLLTQT